MRIRTGSAARAGFLETVFFFVLVVVGAASTLVFARELSRLETGREALITASDDRIYFLLVTLGIFATGSVAR